jgi:dTDP-4-dehydrorhamnose 3,5-epimerase
MFSLKKTQTYIKGVFVLNFGRYTDTRGYFTETLRLSDIKKEIPSIRQIMQSNESYNAGATIRGLHFQWNPPMGKLVRPIQGTVFELILDIRKDSPTLGKGLIIKLTRNIKESEDHWVWAPPGIAHGFFCQEKCTLEYLTTGEYNENAEANICPLAKDIDWSLADPTLVELLRSTSRVAEITDKDKKGPSLSEWLKTKEANNFIYESRN